MTVRCGWRGEATDGELVTLTESHGGAAQPGWWDRIRPHSLGWVTARSGDRTLVGFVNVAWDGGDHAFLIDTKVRPDHQRRGMGTELVSVAARRAKEAGCEWLHVDFDDDLASFGALAPPGAHRATVGAHASSLDRSPRRHRSHHGRSGPPFRGRELRPAL